MRVVSGAVKNLPVPVFLGTSFRESFVGKSFTSERKTVSSNSDHVPILLMIKEGDKQKSSKEEK